MNRTAALFALVFLLVIAGLVLVSSGLYVVTEREQVVVTRFNRPVRVIVGAHDDARDFESLKATIQAAGTPGLKVSQGAGLYMKMPFLDVPERFPDTLIEYDADPETIVTRDKKQLMIDNYARWRIEDPLLFRIRLRSVSEALNRLDDIIYSEMRDELGNNDLIEIIRTTKEFTDFASEEELEGTDSIANEMMLETLSRGREEIMRAVTEDANAVTREQFGIRIVDVRIKRAELLPENLQAVFARMQAERERISMGYLSEGERQAAIIRGETDRDVAIMLAEAKEKAQVLEGEGDAEALRIIADAFSSDPEFYEFIRSLEVIENATPDGAEIVVGLDSSLYKLLAQP